MTLQCSQTCVGSLFLENSTVLVVSKEVCALEQETGKQIQGIGPISWVEEKEMNL